jgi:transketolase
MADIAEVLWNDYLRHNPADPAWVNRDRFVLSNGHGSMLLYSLLHLSGYDLPIEEIKNFRQLHSKTPGHPEYGYAPGVETTTGPLGQGISNAVGMALAEKVLAGQFNRPGHQIVDHNTYTFLGDGCLMEGISHEVCSLAGTLKLGKLVAFYDDNGISIDGEVEGWFSDDTPARFESYGWQVIPNVDGHDSDAIKAAIEQARAETGKPTLICCKTIIGFGSPNKQGKEDCHGAALGVDEVALTREQLGWEHGPFEIPADHYAGWNGVDKGTAAQAAWNEQLAAYRAAHPELAAEFERRSNGDLPADFSVQADAYIQECQDKMEKVASRKASQNCLNAYGPLLPELLGGSADLAGSNLTIWSGSKDITGDNADGNYIYYGVREFGMSAMMNGIALHGGFINYGATFLMFMEYARNAVRMAALMKQQSIFVYTHDSIGLGEDGPTHQPVEQLSALRSTPNLHTWRPCDTVESAVSWKNAIERRDGPAALVFSRQGLAPMPRDAEQVAAIARGGYILKDCDAPQAILIATGSEVELAVNAADELASKGIGVRVVSMPCAEIFSAQDAAYRDSVLTPAIRARVAVEALHADYWYKFVGLDGRVVGMRSFGESAPGGELMKEFGFTVDNVVSNVMEAIG